MSDISQNLNDENLTSDNNQCLPKELLEIKQKSKEEYLKGVELMKTADKDLEKGVDDNYLKQLNSIRKKQINEILKTMPNNFHNFESSKLFK